MPDQQKSPRPVARRGGRFLLFWLAIGFVLFYFYYLNHLAEAPAKEVTYSDFIALAGAGKVKNLTIVSEEGSGEYRPEGEEGGMKRYTVILPGQIPDSDLLLLREKGVDVRFRKPSRWMELLYYLGGPLLLFGLLWFFFFQQNRGIGRGAMSFGKSRARLARDKTLVTFKDVAGVNEAKEELEEVVAFLKDPKRFQRLGGRIPKGVILIGPPGCGKTLLAKAVAGEAGVPFFTISGSDFVEMFVGVGASRVRDMFEQGRKSAPCIIFLDEIDAVGRHRGAGLGGGHDEREQTLNQLLVEMDGFDTQEGVIMIAATNRPDVLDPALTRPGRFDRQIVIDLPDLEGRREILKVHAEKVVLEKEVELERIARGTPGFSGADLANLVNEAALLAARRDSKSVMMEDLEEARDKVRWGRERRSRVMDAEDRKVTAYHEAGHALVLQTIPETEPLHKVTIIPRGIAYLGATMQLPEKDRYHEFRSRLLGELAGLFGGRVAEELIFGDITAGGRSDIKFATDLARRMVCEWGMSERMGPMTFGQREEHIFLGREVSRAIDYSEETALAIDEEVRRIITGAYERARGIVGENRPALDAIARALLKYEVLDGEDIVSLIKSGRIRPKRSRRLGRRAADSGGGSGTSPETDAAAGMPLSVPETDA